MNEQENSIPKRVKLSLLYFLRKKSPKTYSRIIDIPVSENKQNPLSSPTINPLNFNKEEIKYNE